MAGNVRSSSRPGVSVVMPFGEPVHELASALGALSSMERDSADELIIVDNTAGQVVSEGSASNGSVRVVPATDERSSYHARNVGAAAARNDWILFIDSDCVPRADILARYFEEPVDDDVGALVGEIAGDLGQKGLLARYQQDRQYLNQERHLQEPRPYGVTANLLVRAAAWRSVGGFLEGARSGADTEFSWRLQAAGWKLGYRPDASVLHRHRVDARAFVRVTARYAAGRAWLARRYPGAAPRAPSKNSAARALVAAGRWLLAADRERAAFRAIDFMVIVSDRLGRWFSNQPRGAKSRKLDRTISSRPTVVVLADAFPKLSETFIVTELRGLEAQGWAVQVEASRRAERQNLEAVRQFEVSYREDDPPPRKFIALAGLMARHPAACIADLAARRRWAREESVPPLRTIAPLLRRVEGASASHLHAHFAAGAALTALRARRLQGRPFSVATHAYDIFREPCNLREKLEAAAAVTTGCRYNIDYLRTVAPGANLHEIVMGVDAARVRRRSPHPAGRMVIAVGRLVEKKGFGYLIAAVAALEQDEPVDGLLIVGDGPLRRALEDQAVRSGVGTRVSFVGAVEPARVYEMIEQADVMAVPSVIAQDGDRDSMPVVAKEALALEVPVIASDEVGLPELITEEWGRLVPPGESKALAHALKEVLSLPAVERTAMGRAGRAHVLEHCNAAREAQKLLRLIETYSTIMR